MGKRNFEDLVVGLTLEFKILKLVDKRTFETFNTRGIFNCGFV